MAVTESSKVSVLRLKFAVGETSGGDIIKYKRKDIKNVKADATKEDVYAVGKALSDLLETKADVIAKVDEADLEESMQEVDWVNLNRKATKEDVYAVGKALSDLLETKADVIAKVDEADLEESMQEVDWVNLNRKPKSKA